MSSRCPRPRLPRQTQPQRRPHLDHRPRCHSNVSPSPSSKETLRWHHANPTEATWKLPSASSSPACPPSRPSSANPPVHRYSPNSAPNTPTRAPARAPARGRKTPRSLVLRETISITGNLRSIITRSLKKGGVASSQGSR